MPHVTILKAVPGQALHWGGGIPGIFQGEHRFDLAETTPGTTLLSHDEDFEGLFIGFADLPVPVLTQGYDEMNRALKRWVEEGRQG